MPGKEARQHGLAYFCAQGITHSCSSISTDFLLKIKRIQSFDGFCNRSCVCVSNALTHAANSPACTWWGSGTALPLGQNQTSPWGLSQCCSVVWDPTGSALRVRSVLHPSLTGRICQTCRQPQSWTGWTERGGSGWGCWGDAWGGRWGLRADVAGRSPCRAGPRLLGLHRLECLCACAPAYVSSKSVWNLA